MSSTIIYNPSTKRELREILENNEAYVFIKIGSRNCSPCRSVAPVILDAFENMPFNVICVSIDIDESIEVFTFLKSKGWCNTIPALLCYKKGNPSYKPDYMYCGADIDEIEKILNLVHSSPPLSSSPCDDDDDDDDDIVVF
jgi:thiol-disulfide isomerase/thioredoxin